MEFVVTLYVLFAHVFSSSRLPVFSRLASSSVFSRLLASSRLLVSSRVFSHIVTSRIFPHLLASSRVFSDALSSGIVAIPCHEQFEGCEVVEGPAVAQRRVALLA